MSPVLAHSTMSFDGFCTRAQSHVKQRWRDVTHPDGDAQPAMYVYRTSPDGFALHYIPIPFEAFSSRDSKDRLAQALAAVARFPGVRMFGMCWGAWFVKRRLDTAEGAELQRRIDERDYELPDGMPPPSEAPDREEMIQLVAFDPEVTHSWSAEVKRRRKRPPAIGPWRQFSGTDGAELVGLMVDPIRQAMR